MGSVSAEPQSPQAKCWAPGAALISATGSSNLRLLILGNPGAKNYSQWKALLGVISTRGRDEAARVAFPGHSLLIRLAPTPWCSLILQFRCRRAGKLIRAREVVSWRLRSGRAILHLAWCRFPSGFLPPRGPSASASTNFTR